ncbi:LysM peptidoglycan-binding domain-containing protein [Mesorhizobium sp. M0159]|uniref:LysM peptidoglycan-binding domain-containing protein n=1 Tax=unclassified Mesorhizobium TaxID=325217 RepID=UPI00333C2CD8
MVRPITPTKPPVQPQKVNAKANAAQIARLEAQAAKLREQIRLANRMGERDWAAQARQELAHVSTQLDSLQSPPVAASAAPRVNVVNASNGTSVNGRTVTPALYTQTNVAALAATPVKLDGSTPEGNAAEATAARNIVSDVTGGKSIDQIASARGMTREQVVAALRSGGMTVSTADPSGNGDVLTTKITDASGRTITQYYDYQHDSYYTSVEQPNGTATTTPIRDGLGRKETSSYNPDTGAITTRYEDDLGTGTVTERTTLPNGASVEAVTPGNGPALPVTTVNGPDGRKTLLAASQDPGGATTQGIKDDLADGKSIEQIAQERGLTNEQVIAELNAAGYQVTTREPTSDNGDVQSVEVVDPHTGVKTVYYHDYQHDERTVVTTSDGKETTVSEGGNGRTRNSVRNTETGETTTTIVDPKAGTETTIVTDKDGRVTTTTTEEINGGEPVEYEVKPGDNLTLIAQQYGVSLDDLRRTNPELVNSPRDPDIIHPGEKVTIENGARTTVEVTFNGYTLTTSPDGSMTLHNNTTGTDLKIEAGSTQEALARTLLAVNPNSSDATEAKEGEVVKTFVEGLLAGETLPSLIDAAEEAGQNKQDLIERYGLGTVATPKLDGENRVVDPFGDPPQGNAPSGGKWTPMKIDGVWTWIDPEVAQAIIAENIALSQITETRALAGQRQEQFNIYMLDPAYKDAVDGAQTVMNEALAAHGLQWTPQKPEGTLADAQERLTKSNTLLQNAQDARGEYEAAGRILADAIAQQSELAPLIDPNADVASAQGQPGPNRQTQYAQGLADHAAVDQLFSEVGLHLSKGDKLTIDFLVGQAELDGIPTDSKEYQDLKALQTTAGNQLELAEAYQNYFNARAEATQVGAQQTDLEQRLLAEYNSEHQFLFEQGKKHQRVSGDYLGLFQSQKLEVRDGQLWVVNQFEEGTTEQQLTYNLSETNVRDEYRDRQLNKDWQQLLGGSSSTGPVCTANGLEAVRASEAQAAQNLNDVLDRQLGDSIEDLNSELSTLQTNFNNALTEHGPGTVDAAEGTLPDGVQPVEINVGGQTIKVAPEVAQTYNEIGIDALTQSGKAVWIDLDTKDDDASGRWVDPELAVAKLKLDATRLQITQAEELRGLVQGFSDYHELRSSDPSLLVDRNGTVDKTYLDEHEQQTLDGIYQPKFQQLLDSGYDNEFREQRGTALEETVARTLGIDRSTEEGREAIENVTEEIRDIGGDNPYVRSVPIFYVDDEVGTQQVALFAVRDGDGNTRYVDVTGKKFDDLGDFQDNNNQFGEDGKLVVPKGLEMKAGDDGRIELEVVKSRNVSAWDKVVDPLVGIGTGIATILSFTPAAPIAAPLAYTGAAYLGTRAVINQVNHLEHGGEWDDTESLMNVASVATTVLPMASSGLRTIGLAGREMTAAGLAGKEMTALQAFRGSIGATRSSSPLALETRTYMQSTAGLNKAAWGMDVGSVIVGAPLLATSAYDLAVNGEQMNGLQLANALTGLGTGIAGTGLGIHGLRALRPGTGTPASVYRPTGEQGFQDPSHPVIPGEVVNTSDASGDGPTMQPGRDPHGSTGRNSPPPADSGPIIVPNKPAGKDDSMRLVWDPETRSFTGMPEPDTSGHTSPGRTLRLQDKNGEVIVAAMLGTEPRSPEQVYVPPSDGPRAPADAPEVADKTHILVYDPNTGEPVVLPWIRGASDDHGPGSLGYPEEGNQPVEGADDPTRPLRGNVGPFVFRADTRSPTEIRDAGGFSPPPPTGIWVDNPQGIALSNYVMGNTHGRFVGTSQSISGAKAFVSEESRAARQQGYTYLYTLNPSRPRLHVPTEFEAMGRPVSDRMARVDETAVDGSIPWSEVYGWRMMDPDGNFVGEFTRNEDAVAPGTSTQKRPQVILRPADEFWDVNTPAQTEAPPPPVAEVVSNEAPAVTGETPQAVNIAAETPTAATWPPAPDRGRAVFDPDSGKIVSLELPVSSAAEPGYAEPVRAPTGPEVRALSADQISELTGTQLHAIKPEHIAKLAPEQVAALSPEQIGQLTFDQLAALRPKQLRALSAEQLQAIRPSRLQAVAPGRITGLRPDQVAAFSPEQLAALTIEQVRKLTPDQIAKLSDEQRNALTSEQVAAMRPAQFGHLDATQFAALNPDLVAARDPVATAKLSPDHISALTREQLGALTIHQIEALTKQQIAALTPKQLAELSPGQLRKFTPKQFAWMSTEQTNALSVLQLTTYRATHKKAMTPDQATSVDLALSYARMRENAQALATFGGMSTTSYMLWSSLPPTWTATAGSVAFGVRGMVFGAQALFPNATAGHKPFGRFLNALGGATFIAAAPGAATGMIQGKDLVVNSTFTLGNIVYGTKSMLQSFTGRPVIRNLAEHLAGPGYVLGCAVYTLHSWPAPIATVAGTMFTFGCAEFWASAIRTDRMNRRSVPRTDADIAAAEKSDKRWAAWDRWTLGITFGVGMLLFSLDALLAEPWEGAKTPPPPDPKKPDGDASSQQPDDPSDVPGGPQISGEDFPQLVVVADDGLNLRTQSDGDSTVGTVLQPGTFVEQTAKPSTDPSGETWIPVEGFAPDGEMHSGWVSGDYVEAHAEGSSNPEGRTNPTLEKDGYRWVEVRDGDSIRLIAKTHSADVADTVVLNMDHILSPDVIFSGDRVYLPITSIG